jgi:hypothetical protein
MNMGKTKKIIKKVAKKAGKAAIRAAIIAIATESGVPVKPKI